MNNKQRKRFPLGTIIFVLASIVLLIFGLYWVLEGMKTPAPFPKKFPIWRL